MVVGPTTVRAEAGVRHATAFLRGEGAMAGAGAIHVHGNMTKWGRGRGGTVRDNRGGAGRGVGRALGAGGGSSRLILLHHNRHGHVVVLYYIVYGHTCEIPLYNNIRYINVVVCVNAM